MAIVKLSFGASTGLYRDEHACIGRPKSGPFRTRGAAMPEHACPGFVATKPSRDILKGARAIP